MRWLLWIVACVAVPSPTGLQWGAEPPVAVTTDTPAFCESLSETVRAEPNPPPDALRLWREGQRMCAEGEILGGVARLRRAVLLSRGEQAQ